VSAVDPTIPDEHVDHPGPITVALADDTFVNTARKGGITFPEPTISRLRRDHLAKVRGEVVVEERDGQAPLMRCKMAALLALLDGRTAVNDEDWRLAGLMWETSCAFRDAVIDAGRQEKARYEEIKAQLRVQLAERHLFDTVAEKAEALGLLRRTLDGGALLPPLLAVPS